MKLVVSLLLGMSAAVALAATPATPAPKKKPLPPLGTAMDRPGARSTPKPVKPLTLSPNPATPPPTAPPGAGVPDPGAARSLSFEARQISSGGSNEANTTRTLEGSLAKSRVRKSQTTLEIQVRNLAREAGTAHFDWFFVAKAVTRESTYVWDRGERDVPVPAAGQKRETVDSGELESTVTLTTSTSSSGQFHTSEKKGGSRPYGWIIRMSVGGKLVKVQASNPELDKIARDPAQFAELLKAQPPLDPGTTGSK